MLFFRRIQQQQKQQSSFVKSTIRMFVSLLLSILLLTQSSLLLLLVVPYCTAFTITTTPKLQNNQQQQKSLHSSQQQLVSRHHWSVHNPTNLCMSQSSPSSSSTNENEQQQQQPNVLEPQAFASGYSTNVDLVGAIREAFVMARSGLPSTTTQIDMVWVSISSLYEGGGSIPGTSATPTVTVPIVLAAAQGTGVTIKNIIGSTVAGCISSQVSSSTTTTSIPKDDSSTIQSTTTTTSCQTIELESIPSVSITLGVLPDTNIITFQISAPDLPDHEDDIKLSSAKEWKRSLGLSRLHSVYDNNEKGNDNANNKDVPPTSFFVLPSPSFTTNQIQTLLGGLNKYFPSSQIAGGIASTVSSLSRARLFQWTAGKGDTSTSCYTDGCVGVAFQGDVKWQTLQALGAKPVGGVYQIVAGQESTIKLIQLDEDATESVKAEEESEYGNKEEDDDDEDEEDEKDTSKTLSAKEAIAKFYAKALIPKPVLAEANFLMRTLSDDDQAFMRRQLLVGLEDYGSASSSTSASGRIASELARLAAGEGHRFRVYTVASAGMKDGSVTLPLVSNVQIYKGQRLRFFVREPDFATKEINALWLGYQQRMLNDQFATTTTTDTTTKVPFRPGACFIIPTLDRGNKFFQGQKSGYESFVASQKLNNVQSISGFFSNGVVGSVMDFSSSSSSSSSGDARTRIGVQGSASGYFLLGSWSGRPVYSAAAAAAKAAAADAAAVAAAIDTITTNKDRTNDAEIANKPRRGVSATILDRAAPRAENGELILKRREVHSGRALTVSAVEWSVAEKTARPSSTLEGYMWEKETEVDRFRERVPLANLLSQCRLSVVDPTLPKPRDWVGPVKQAIATSDNKFIIIPECKRIDPATTGSIRRRYDLNKIVRDFTIAGVPALSVNCDGVLFGGSLDHITTARSESSAAAIETITNNSIDNDGVLVPPILASDLLLYPYQLYKLRLAGADAVNIIVGALEQKDLLYLTKIASSVQLQVLATVTSEVQLQTILNYLPANSLQGIILSNRELEDYSFDETGEQVLRLLRSPTLHKIKEQYGGDNLLVLVEGRIGLIERTDDTTGSSTTILSYIKELKTAGAMGAIVGAGLASATNAKELQDLLASFQAA